MAYTCYFAQRDISGSYGGVYLSEDFLLTGTQPTWRKVSGGLASNDIYVFRVDPFSPLTRQYLQVANAEKELYRRDTTVSDDWVKILDKTTAAALIGDYWPAGIQYDTLTDLSWICPDPVVRGRLYAVWSNAYLAGTGPHLTYLLRSDDYGDTWTYFDVGGANFCARGAQTVETYGNHLWVGIAHPLVPTGGVAYSPDGGTTWYKTTFGSSTLYWYQIYIDPGNPDQCYCIRFSTSAADRDLIRINYSGGVLTTTVLQGATNLGGAYASKTANAVVIDQLWINPNDSNHMRIQSGGHLYYTADGWTNLTDAGVLTGPAINTFITNVVSPNDTPTPILFAKNGVWSLTNETDVSGENRSGTNWNTPPYTDAIPVAGSYAAYWGLWVGIPLTKGIYVYAVELGGDCSGEHGIPMHGDRSAWDDVGYPDEHAHDICDDTPIYHTPYPGAAGEAVVSDGTKWTSRALTLADLGLVPTQIGQVIISIDGSTFSVQTPLIGEGGWLVDEVNGVLLVV